MSLHLQNKPAPAQDEREAFKRALHSQKVFKLSSATIDAAEWAWFARPAQTEQQPLAWLIDWPEEPELGHYFSDEPNEHARSRPLYAAPIAQTAPQHPDDAAVDRFAAAMKAKLAKSRAKGRGGWDDPNVCSVEFLAQLLVEHLGKGNAGTFEDVANFAMMLHQRGADPKVLAEAAEAPIKKARGEALELGVRALESKSEHTEPAPAQDAREAFGLSPDQLEALAERLKQYREAHKDDLCSPQEVLRQCKAWAGSDQYHGTGTGDSFQRAADLIEALLSTRPAQTEQQPAYVECRECTDCGHVGINDAHQTDATCAMCDWSGPSPVEDQCPDCGKENVMGAACPKCSGRYRILAETHVAAPIAQTAPHPEQSGLVEALEAIVRQYPNPDISHVDYRVHACRQAEQALDAYRAALPNHRGGA